MVFIFQIIYFYDYIYRFWIFHLFILFSHIAFLLIDEDDARMCG